MKNYSTQPFKECLFFIFCLFYFLFLSNNTLHIMLYTYICYWNTFQYKYIIQITFHVIKQSHVTSKDICLLFMIYLLFAYFCFILTSFYFMKLSSSLIFNWPCDLKFPNFIIIIIIIIIITLVYFSKIIQK